MDEGPENVVARVRACLERYRTWVDRGPVAVGFSGGPDSTALLLCLHELRVPVTAVHFHHGLRGAAADADLAWAQACCHARDIPFTAIHLDVPARRRNREGVEAAARRLRLAYWEERAQHEPGLVVALGHQLGDRIETLLLRLLRGSNCTGLTGLREWREFGGVRYLRPLLDCRREELVAYLRARGVEDWREDETNADPRLLRNRLRHQVVPLLTSCPGGRDGLATSLELLMEDALALEEQAAALVAARPETLGLQWLAELPPACRARVLRAWLATRGWPGIGLRRQALDDLEIRLRDPGSLPRPWRLALAPGYYLCVAQGQLRLEHRLPVRACPLRSWFWRQTPVLAVPELGCQLRARVLAPQETPQFGPGREYFASTALGECLTVRARRPGDRLVPFGRDDRTTLKKLLAAVRLDAEQKRRICVLLTAAGEIVWVPGVRRAQVGVVESPTGEVVELQCGTLKPPPAPGWPDETEHDE